MHRPVQGCQLWVGNGHGEVVQPGEGKFGARLVRQPERTYGQVLRHEEMQELFSSNGFDLGPHIVALIAAYLLALPIGWNREKEERSAGLRTFPLVAVAS